MLESSYVLPAPTVPDLATLAKSTEQALSILRPWCTVSKHYKSSQALISFQNQALSYVKAVNDSITAAQNGYTITNEVLDFVQIQGRATEEERQDYLRGMLRLAKEGQENAMLAFIGFREVKFTVSEDGSTQLVRNAEQELDQENKKFLSFLRSRPGHLEANIAALEKFGQAISLYMAWWNNLNMSHNSITSRTMIDYSSLRDKGIIESWRTLQSAYVDYTNKIIAIQDLDPTFASQFERTCNVGTERVADTVSGDQNEPKKKKRKGFKLFRR